MKITNAIPVFAIGLSAGVALVLSCGDDGSTSKADAATQCDCPLSEPPLSGRLTRITHQFTVPALGPFGGTAFCPDSYIVLSGGCLANSNDPKYTLQSSYAGPVDTPRGWGCVYYNGTAAEVTSTAFALCLKPAP
jgi:hypothetical protein